MLILVPALILTALPQVDTRELRTHKWFCTANGQDSDRRNRSVSGPFKPTRPKAEEAAFSQCVSMGLIGCYVSTCIDESVPSIR